MAELLCKNPEFLKGAGSDFLTKFDMFTKGVMKGGGGMGGLNDEENSSDDSFMEFDELATEVSSILGSLPPTNSETVSSLVGVFRTALNNRRDPRAVPVAHQSLRRPLQQLRLTSERELERLRVERLRIEGESRRANQRTELELARLRLEETKLLLENERFRTVENLNLRLGEEDLHGRSNKRAWYNLLKVMLMALTGALAFLLISASVPVGIFIQNILHSAQPDQFAHCSDPIDDSTLYYTSQIIRFLLSFTGCWGGLSRKDAMPLINSLLHGLTYIGIFSAVDLALIVCIIAIMFFSKMLESDAEIGPYGVVLRQPPLAPPSYLRLEGMGRNSGMGSSGRGGLVPGRGNLSGMGRNSGMGSSGRGGLAPGRGRGGLAPGRGQGGLAPGRGQGGLAPGRGSPSFSLGIGPTGVSGSIVSEEGHSVSLGTGRGGLSGSFHIQETRPERAGRVGRVGRVGRAGRGRTRNNRNEGNGNNNNNESQRPPRGASSAASGTRGTR